MLLSSTLWDGSVAQKLLFKLIKNDVKIFTSEDILSEYKKILKRDFEYSDEEVIVILGKLVLFLNIVISVERVSVIGQDPDDNKIIDCALASSSDYILTYDNLKSFRNIEIVRPEEAFGLV